MNQKIDPIILQRYQIIKKVGQGSYGTVYKAKDKKPSNINSNNTTIALKKIHDAYRNDSDAQRIYRQLMYCKQFSHRNLTKMHYYHVNQHSRDIYMIMQYVQYDLQKIISQSLFQSDAQKYFLMSQLINAIQYLHSVDLIHRDLKPANILLTNQWIVKLCDFGLIKSVNKKDQNDQIPMTQNIATRWYRAPQILLGSDSYGKPVDIWSIGCIFAQIITGKVLFPGQNPLNQLQKIIQITGKPQKQTIKKMTSIDVQSILEDQKFSKQKKTLKSVLNIQELNLIDLIGKMLQFDSFKRITIQEIKSHPFITKLMKNNISKSSSSLLKSQKPIKIQYGNEMLNIKKYKNLINMYADPIFQENQEVRQRGKTSVCIQINPELYNYSSSNHIKIKTPTNMTTSSIYYPKGDNQKIENRARKTIGLEQMCKLKKVQSKQETSKLLSLSYNIGESSNMKKGKNTTSSNALTVSKEVYYVPNKSKKNGKQETNPNDFSFEQKKQMEVPMGQKIKNSKNQLNIKSIKNSNLNSSFQPQPQIQNQTQNLKIDPKTKDQMMNRSYIQNNNQTQTQNQVKSTLTKREQFQRQIKINDLKKSSLFLSNTNNKKTKC